MDDGEPNKPKGILKKTPQKSAAAQAREVALRQAHLIQNQKDLQSEILDSIVLLSEFPTCRDSIYSAGNPAPSDIISFKTHVRLFQPSDYDDLIVERNVNGLCGYTLCPKAKKETGPGGIWKIANDGSIVKREEIEKWCSKLCAKRAMHVKVQLNETAAWERAGNSDIHIDLLEEEELQTEADIAARRLASLRLEDQQREARDAAALLEERGQPSLAALRRPLEIRLREKETVLVTNDVSTDSQGDHMMVEGYKPKLGDASSTSSKNQ